MRNAFLIITIIAILNGCTDSRNKASTSCSIPIKNSSFFGTVRFQELKSTTGFKILLEDSIGEVKDQTIFRYVPYRFDTIDINQDCQTEIVVGLLKSTRFDPIVRKRLFILKIDEYNIRPMWLGSKVCQELLDFRAMPDGSIHTLERSKSGCFDLGNYYWQSFGLTLKGYTNQEISYTDATQILHRM